MTPTGNKVIALAMALALMLPVGIDLARAGRAPADLTGFTFDYVGPYEGKCRYLARVEFVNFQGGQKYAMVKVRKDLVQCFCEESPLIKGKATFVEWYVDLIPGSYVIEEVSLRVRRKGAQDSIQPMTSLVCSPTY
jgi:uncharacterized protein (UPF0179 family)